MNRIGVSRIFKGARPSARQLLARRTTYNPNVETKNFKIASENVSLKPGETMSSNVKNGTVGQPLFPGTSLFRSILKEIPKAGEALAAIVLLFVAIPYGLVLGSDYLYGVPDRNDTSAVTFTKDGAVAHIPQTFAPIDKEEDEEDEEEDEEVAAAEPAGEEDKAEETSGEENKAEETGDEENKAEETGDEENKAEETGGEEAKQKDDGDDSTEKESDNKSHAKAEASDASGSDNKGDEKEAAKKDSDDNVKESKKE